MIGLICRAVECTVENNRAVCWKLVEFNKQLGVVSGGGEKPSRYDTAVTQGLWQAHPELHLPKEQNQRLINVCMYWVGEGVERLTVK